MSRVKSLGSISEGEAEELENIGVASLRSDNAKENVMRKLRSWCDSRGTSVETTIPHTPYQNGKAERIGGSIMSSGACLRYGGNLPPSSWLHCCLAAVYHRNRLPSKSCAEPGKTPFEVFEGVSVPLVEQLAYVRVIGCLCYVLLPLKKRVGKSKRVYRAVLLGYSESLGQKGYIVRNLSTGVVGVAAHNQIHCFEQQLVYPVEAAYDAWLRRKTAGHAEKERKMYREHDTRDEHDFVVDDDDSDDSDDSEDSDVSERATQVMTAITAMSAMRRESNTRAARVLAGARARQRAAP